ncbi:MAG: hypothetical protein V4487_06150 [Chlamydiota bacterium]
MRTHSDVIYEKSCRSIPGGVNFPVRAFQGLGMTPLIVESGEADTIRDGDGNFYIHYCCS